MKQQTKLYSANGNGLLAVRFLPVLPHENAKNRLFSRQWGATCKLLLKKKIALFFTSYTCVFACAFVCRFTWSPIDDVRATGTGVTGNCKLHDMSAKS